MTHFLEVWLVCGSEELAHARTHFERQTPPFVSEVVLQHFLPEHWPILDGRPVAETRYGKNAPEILVAAFQNLSANLRAHGLRPDDRVFQQMGQRHHLRPGDENREVCRNGMVFRNGKKTITWQDKVTSGRFQADRKSTRLNSSHTVIS